MAVAASDSVVVAPCLGALVLEAVGDVAVCWTCWPLMLVEVWLAHWVSWLVPKMMNLHQQLAPFFDVALVPESKWPEAKSVRSRFQNNNTLIDVQTFNKCLNVLSTNICISCWWVVCNIAKGCQQQLACVPASEESMDEHILLESAAEPVVPGPVDRLAGSAPYDMSFNQHTLSWTDVNWLAMPCEMWQIIFTLPLIIMNHSLSLINDLMASFKWSQIQQPRVIASSQPSLGAGSTGSWPVLPASDLQEHLSQQHSQSLDCLNTWWIPTLLRTNDLRWNDGLTHHQLNSDPSDQPNLDCAIIELGY